MRQFKGPPVGHLKIFEGCRLAAKNKGTLGYSNILQKSSPGILDLYHAPIIEGIEMLVKTKHPKEGVKKEKKEEERQVNEPLIHATQEPRKRSLFEKAAAHKTLKLKRKRYGGILDESSEDEK